MSMEELTKNFQFYYKPNNSTGTPANGECRVYLYYEGGTPAEKFDSIEMGVRLNLVRITGGNDTIKNVVFDNFILKNGGAHGIALAKADGVDITNCFIYNMGGGVYNYTDDGKNTGRYGNGVEINRGCRNITVDGNYIYQIYDAGLTHQFDTRTSLSATTECIFENIKYENNVISHCFYGIEFFVSPALEDTSTVVIGSATSENKPLTNNYKRYMKDITISGNYILYSGYGWGYMRDTSSQKGAAHIKTWAHFGNSIVDNEGISIISNSFAFSRYDVICGAFEKEADMPNLSNNTFVQSSMGKTITLTLAPLGTTTRIFDSKEYEFYTVDEVPADNRAYWNEAELEATYTGNTFVTAEDINV